MLIWLLLSVTLLVLVTSIFERCYHSAVCYILVMRMLTVDIVVVMSAWFELMLSFTLPMLILQLVVWVLIRLVFLVILIVCCYDVVHSVHIFGMPMLLLFLLMLLMVIVFMLMLLTM